MFKFILFILLLANPGADVTYEKGTFYIDRHDGIVTAVKYEQISKNPPSYFSSDE